MSLNSVNRKVCVCVVKSGGKIHVRNASFLSFFSVDADTSHTDLTSFRHRAVLFSTVEGLLIKKYKSCLGVQRHF